MSDAVSTYRFHADWSRRVAAATPDPKDAALLRERASHLSALADRVEAAETQSLVATASPPLSPELL